MFPGRLGAYSGRRRCAEGQADAERSRRTYHARMPEERDAKIDVGAGVSLWVRDFEAPNPAAPGLLLHHGLASTSHIWDLMLPGLVRRYHVVAYDARGHGLSGKPSSGYGFERVGADALAVIRATKLRAPVVVGHSWGAMVALDLAANHPRSVSGAVLVDGGLAALRGMGTWTEVKQQLAPPHLAGMPVDEFRTAIGRWMPMPVTPLIEGHVLSIMRVDSNARIHPRLSRANHFRILRAIWEQDHSFYMNGCAFRCSRSRCTATRTTTTHRADGRCRPRSRPSPDPASFGSNG
jgi:pimeloyl-ACP methyl ester carboxylesterase